MSLTTTGVPSCMASTSGMPNPSSRDAETSAVAPRSTSRYTSSVAPSWNTSRAAGASADSRARSSTEIRLIRCSSWSGSDAIARTSVATFLYGMNEPM